MIPMRILDWPRRLGMGKLLKVLMEFGQRGDEQRFFMTDAHSTVLDHGPQGGHGRNPGR